MSRETTSWTTKQWKRAFVWPELAHKDKACHGGMVGVKAKAVQQKCQHASGSKELELHKAVDPDDLPPVRMLMTQKSERFVHEWKAQSGHNRESPSST